MKQQYYFAELDISAQERAVENNKEWALDEDWYEDTIDLFRDLGVDIDAFNLFSYNLSFELTQSIEQVCENIINEIGFDWAEMCQNYLDSVDAQLALEPIDQDMLDDMEALFLKDLELDILGWLNKEYMELTEFSRVAEYLEDFGLLFDKEGNKINEDE